MVVSTPFRATQSAVRLAVSLGPTCVNSWREFVRQHTNQILATDFFVVLRRDVALAAVGTPIHV